MIDEQDIKDWEKLPLVSRVLTSQQMGAWLYYRDKRRDKKVNSELLDKVAEKIKEYSGLHYVDCDGYFGGEKELIFKVDDWLDDIIAELKAEVE